MNKEKIQDRYLKEYKTIYVDIGDRKCFPLVIPVYYNETLPNDFILRPEILTQIAVLNLISKNEELQQQNKKYKQIIDKAKDVAKKQLLSNSNYTNYSDEMCLKDILEIFKEVK